MPGWADAVWDQGARFGTVGLKKGGTDLRGHHPPGRGLRAGLAQAGRVLRRRGRGRPLRGATSRSTPWRCGSPAPTTRPPSSSTPSAASPTWPPRSCARRCRPRCPSPTTRCGCCARRASSPATASCPTTDSRAPWRELRARLEIVSAERVRDELSKLLVVDDPEPRALVPRRHRASPTSSSPSCRPCAWSRIPIHRHKDVLAHTIAVVAKTRPSLIVRMAALLHDVGQAQDAVHRPQGRVLPPPRGGRRPHGQGPAARAAVPERAGGGHQPARLPPPALPRLRRRRVDRQRRAPLRPRRRARCSTT